MKFSPSTMLLGAASVALVGAFGVAQIVRLDLPQMVAQTDGAIYGTIVDSEVIRIDHPIDGPELYYTTLFIEGRVLGSSQPSTVGITFAGGFIDEEHGVWNSEAPSEEDTKIGNRVVAFHKRTINMGGDLEARALYAAHGGLFRTIEGRKGVVVQGRGVNYAIPSNIALADLDQRITQIDKEIQEAKKQ